DVHKSIVVTGDGVTDTLSIASNNSKNTLVFFAGASIAGDVALTATGSPVVEEVIQDTAIAAAVGDASVTYTGEGTFEWVSNIGVNWVSGGGYRDYDVNAIATKLESYAGFQVVEGWLNGDQFITDKFYTNLTDWAADAEAYWQIKDPSAQVSFDTETGRVLILTSESVGQMGIMSLKFQDYTTGLSITAASGGVDPLQVNDLSGLSYDTPYVDGTEHEVSLQFSNTYLESAEIAGETISVTVDDVVTTFVVTQDLLDARDSTAQPDQSEFIVAKLLEAIAADHTGQSTLDVAAVVQDGNVLSFKANTVGAGLLDLVTSSVTKDDGTANKQAAVVSEVIAPGTSPTQASTASAGITINDADGEGNAVTGADSFKGSSDEAGFTDGDYGLQLDDQSTPGEADDPIGQTVTNPSDNGDFYGDSALTGSDGVDLTGTNPSDDATYSGDAPSTGSGNGVDQSFDAPTVGYVAVSGSPAAGSGNAGDGALYGSEPGAYVDKGVTTDFLSGGVDDNTDGTYEAQGTDSMDVIGIDDGTGGKSQGIVGQVASEVTDTNSDMVSVTLDDTGFAAYTWDQAQVDVLTPGSLDADTVVHFQTGNDFIGIEGGLAASTVSGALDAVASRSVYIPTSVSVGASSDPNIADSRGSTATFDFGDIDLNAPFEVSVARSDGTLFNLLDAPTGWTRLGEYKVTETSFANVDDFVAHVLSTKTWTTGTEDPTYSVSGGVLTFTAPEGYAFVTHQVYSLQSDGLAELKTYFDLSEHEFGLDVGGLDSVSLDGYDQDNIYLDDYSVGTSGVSVSVDGGATFTDYTIADGETILDLVDLINADGLVIATADDGESFVLTEKDAADELHVVFDLSMSWGESTSVLGTASDVLVTPLGSLSAADLGDVDLVVQVLNEAYDFTAGTNDQINTSIFAITASDDPNQVAIWAHTQSDASDDTVDALELTLLATVDTEGEDFSYQNLMVSLNDSWQQPEILQNQVV
uniref:hypothetical protein n=1 Tax=Sulfitobacter sp. TaxID=1903071 RepID=UPI003F6A5CCF